MSDSIPKYERRLDAMHRALVDDFRQLVEKIPISPGQVVLDVGCGDGFFASLLACSEAQVIGVDSADAFLQLARHNTQAQPNIRLVKGDARELPFDDASADVIWSGYSMHSYPDIPRCLNEFRRVLRPGGILAVLESDNVHSIMLSWPPDLELAVRQAEHQEIQDEDTYVGTYFPRFALDLLTKAGFEDCRPEYILIHRQGPANETLTEYVKLYLTDLLERTHDKLSDKMRSKFSLLASPTSDQFLPHRNSFFFGSLQVLMLARASGVF